VKNYTNETDKLVLTPAGRQEEEYF